MAIAMTTISNKNSRFTDILDEPIDRLLSPIKGYENKPLLPLMETVKPIAQYFNDIQDNVFVALHNCQNPLDNLTQDESASIHLYTMQFLGGPSLYYLLNQTLRDEKREELIPWFSFLKLFLTALHKLPSQKERVWRGVRNIDLNTKYEKGTKFVWWGVSSCTSDIELLESNNFFGKQGQRTLFSIDCLNGKSIINHSHYKKEKEVLLMPGFYFEVIGKLNSGHNLHIIEIKEILPPIDFVKPPFFKRFNGDSFSTSNKSNSISQLLSRVKTKITSSNILNDEISLPLILNRKWKQIGITIAGGNGVGHKQNQFYLPEGIFLDDDQTIYIADMGNHRIIQWKSNAKNGQIIAGGNGQGNKMNQLNCPTDVIIDKENKSLIISDQDNRRVMRWSYENNTNGEIIISNIKCFGLAMDKDSSLYVSDREKSQVKRWKKGEKNGTIVAGGNGQGNQVNQLNWPTFIFIDEDYSLYISDSWNHRIMKWIKDAKEGIIVAGGNGEGKSLKQMSYPYGITIDQLGQIYVADSGNHRIMCWCKGAKEGTIIVGKNEQEQQSINQLKGPIGLSFDRQGNLYVGDHWNHRIQKFEIDENVNNTDSDIVLIEYSL